MSSHPRPDQAKILITGLIRNGEAHIAQDVGKLLSATRGFREVHVLIIESDSTDGTLAKLAELARASSRVQYKSLGSLQSSLPMRSERMAHCRNAYLREIRDNPAYADVDYVIVSDLDGMNDKLSPASFASCWARGRLDWGVLTANQDGYYYDIWALRHPDWSPDDCLRLLSRLEPLFGHEVAREMAVYTRQVRVTQDMPWIPVESAFGGLAIYTREAILAGGYAAYGEDGHEICEHVPHHLKIRRAGHAICINPGLINTGQTIHTKNKRTSKVIRNAIKAHFRRR